MEAFLAIFKSLGVDQTIFVQFTIIIVLYLILKNLLYKKLLFVIQNREANISKLDEKSEKGFELVEKMEIKYKEIIDRAYQLAQDKLSTRRNEIIEKEHAIYRKAEEHALAEFEEQKKIVIREGEEKRVKVLKETDGLSSDFVNKLLS